MNSLEEKTIFSEKIYKGELLDVRKDKVSLPDNKIGYREWINHPGASCCVPILPDNKIILVKQYRYAIKDESIEIPAGKIDSNEDPKQCANRELIEETGFKSNKLTLLTSIYPAIGFANEKIWIYLAEDLEKSNSKTDNDEFIEIISIDHNTAMKMIMEGMIKDSKTIIGIMWLDKYFNHIMSK